MSAEPPSALRQAAGPALAGAVLLLIACLGGGWLALGRVDPLLTVPGAGWAAAAGALAGRGRMTMPVWGIHGLGIAACLALIQWTAAGWVDWLPTMLAAFIVAVPLVPASWMVARARDRAGAMRYLSIGLVILCAWGWQLLASPLVARAYDPAPTDERPRVVVLTSLPLFAASRGDLGAVLSGEVDDAPAIRVLRPHFDLLPAADVGSDTLRGGDALLLAHPGPLPPEVLVAIDKWVRGGGRAVVLADALLEAEPPYPLGDPRNPPVSTMLDPLLAHWGVAIGPARAGALIVNDARQRLVFSSAGDVIARSAACRSGAGGVVARCRIGQGQVVIVGDADMLDPSLWNGQADPVSRASWHSANMSWLASQLSPESAGRYRLIARPVWVR